MDGDDNYVIETVEVFVRLDHSSRGHLKIALTSPSGTTSIVHPSKRPENLDVQTWKFITQKAWGETPFGNWTLSVEDEKAGDVETCVDDAAFSFPIGSSDSDPLTVTCRVLDINDFCQTGGTSLAGVSLSGPDDSRLTGTNGMTPADACCSCGGGILVSDYVDVLQDWRVIVYGRSSLETERVTTGAPTFSPISGEESDAPKQASPVVVALVTIACLIASYITI